MSHVREMGKYLMRRRQELGLTQGDIADRLDCSQAYVSKWELGINRRLDIGWLRRLARAYDTDINTLARVAGFTIPLDVQPQPEEGAVRLARALPALTAKQEEMLITYAHWLRDNYFGHEPENGAQSA